MSIPDPTGDASAIAIVSGSEGRERFPALDWHSLFADDHEEEWLHEPLLPARRSVVIYSPPKVGKSLLMLEFAVALSRAESFLGYQIKERQRVLYVDFENDPRGDIRARLRAMDYGPDDLDQLHYLSFPTLAGLDTARGAVELLEAVNAYRATVVVIDTVSRAVEGEENSNDTWLGLYRHTGLKLKQAGVAVVRLDHTGKDETKGQRGGSAKSGDVDAVWRLSRVSDERFRLECTDSRMQIDAKSLSLTRRRLPRLHHSLDASSATTGREAKIAQLVNLADANGLPADASREAIRDLAKRFGIGGRNDVFGDAARARKAVPAVGDSAARRDLSPQFGTARDSGSQNPRDHAGMGCPQPSGTAGDNTPSPSLSPSQHPMGGTVGTAGRDAEPVGLDAAYCSICGLGAGKHTGSCKAAKR